MSKRAKGRKQGRRRGSAKGRRTAPPAGNPAPASQPQNQTGTPFYFIVVFWGREHRIYFLRLCLASLLSKGNIPALSKNAGHRMVIATTREDWDAIQAHPTFRHMKKYIEPLFLKLERPGPDDSKMLAMSKGHKLASTRAFDDKAMGVYLTPDLVLTDGSVAALDLLSRDGAKVVMCAAVRFAWETCIPEMRRRFDMKAGKALTLPPRELCEVALNSLHSETMRYNWEKSYFVNMPIVCYWDVPKGEGVVVHSFSWAPLLVNYAALESHDTKTFDEWTLDGDYIYRNFPNKDDVYVVTDSDEIMLVSFTRESELHFKLKRSLLKIGPWAKGIKQLLLRRLFFSHIMDPLKRDLFPTKVRWHWGDIGPQWAPVENRAKLLIEEAVQMPHTGRDDYIYVAVELGIWRAVSNYAKYFSMRANQKYLFPFSNLLRRGSWIWPLSMYYKAGLLVERRRETKHVNQSGIENHRGKLVGPGKSSGRWYWEIVSDNLGVLDGSVSDTAAIGVVGKGYSMLDEVGGRVGGWGWRADGHKVSGVEAEPHGEGAVTGREVVMVALDADAGKLWFGLNGRWFGGGSPSSGAVACFENLEGRLFPAVSSRYSGKGTAVMETSILAKNFRYDLPDGYRPLVGN
jgi:hypothetical protein